MAPLVSVALYVRRVPTAPEGKVTDVLVLAKVGFGESTDATSAPALLSSKNDKNVTVKSPPRSIIAEPLGGDTSTASKGNGVL